MNKTILERTLILIFLLLEFIALSATSNEIFNPKTIVINGKTWMKENYHPSMANPQNNVKGVTYKYLTNIDIVYGNLFTYDEALKACPQGWHLPTIEEWNELFEEYGGIDLAGGHLKSLEYWQAPNTGASNSSGFSALPAGGANDTNRFDGFGWSAHFWSNSKNGSKIYVPSLMHDTAAIYVLELSPKMRASVRYVKDKDSE